MRVKITSQHMQAREERATMIPYPISAMRIKLAKLFKLLENIFRSSFLKLLSMLTMLLAIYFLGPLTASSGNMNWLFRYLNL